MSIYKPVLHYSENDKRLLYALADLLTREATELERGTNVPIESLELSVAEIDKLALMIGELLDSKEFVEASYFVEEIAASENMDERSVKEIYLSARKRRGRSRAMSSKHWDEFQIRLGVRRKDRVYWAENPMSTKYFMEMEQKLFEFLGVNPRVSELAIRALASRAQELRKLRETESGIRRGSVRRIFQSLQSQEEKNKLGKRILDKDRIVSAFICVADLGALFTTRDWSVAGTLSCMASTISPFVPDN